MYTYLISNGAAVKIGRTTNVRQRLTSLQGAQHAKLELLAIIEGDIEQELHIKFRTLRLAGEWFAFAREIEDFVSNLRKERYGAWMVTILEKAFILPIDEPQPIVEQEDSLHIAIQTFLASLPPSLDGRKRVITSELKKAIGVNLNDRRTATLIAERMRSYGYKKTVLRVRRDYGQGSIVVGYEERH